MKIALVGNQNSGKTTLFNAITGSNQKIGNWPGVTIERKEGILKGSKNISIIDLPGIYSLSPYTKEEEVSRRFIIDEKPDLIINIIDSTSLERSLYLTTQLLELDADVILALNMTDILSSHGIEINIESLSKELDVSIIPISAAKGNGINELISLINNKKYKRNKHINIYPKEIEGVIAKFNDKLSIDNKRFASVKLIEDDSGYHELKNQKDEELVKKLEKHFDMDGEQLIASKRYDFIESVVKKCVTVSKKKDSLTDKLDHIFLNKWAAIPIFIGIMAIVYLLSVGIVGGFLSPLIDVLFNGTNINEPITFNYVFSSFSVNWSFLGLGPWLGSLINNAGGSPWAVSLVQDGIIKGVSAVLVFLPQITAMFIFLSILETSGYMSRIAFFLDRIFHKFGLSGKSLIPFIVGSGCSVPGVMSTRIIEDENERKSSIVLTSFIPCSAKLPLITIFTSFFFKSWAWLVALSFYLIAIVIILLFGYIFKKLFFKEEHSYFVVELPEYKKPRFNYVIRDVGEKSLSFVKKAGTVILLFSILVWFLSSFTWDLRYLEISKINESMLASIGNALAWFFYPMLGVWSWGATVSAIQGLVAKEQVVASMQILAGSSDIFGPNSMFNFFNGVTAFAYLTFNLFSAPCIATLATIKKEGGSFKFFILTMLFQIALAWILATSIGAIGRGFIH